MSNYKPAPWDWVADDQGPPDEHGCRTPGPIDIDTWKPTGYCDNAYIPGVLSAGAGEYFPVDGETPEQTSAHMRLLRAAPDMAEALRMARCCLSDPHLPPSRRAGVIRVINAALERAGLGES